VLILSRSGFISPNLDRGGLEPFLRVRRHVPMRSEGRSSVRSVTRAINIHGYAVSSVPTI
jgi:hypothetical protein